MRDAYFALTALYYHVRVLALPTFRRVIIFIDLVLFLLDQILVEAHVRLDTLSIVVSRRVVVIRLFRGLVNGEGHFEGLIIRRFVGFLRFKIVSAALVGALCHQVMHW